MDLIFPIFEESSDEEEDLDETEEAVASSMSERRMPAVPTIYPVTEPVEDFLINYLRRKGLKQTAARFRTEWYLKVKPDIKQKVRTQDTDVSDAYLYKYVLRSELDLFAQQTNMLRKHVAAVKQRVVSMRRERAFHGLQYGRVQEYKQLLRKKLKKLYTYKPAVAYAKEYLQYLVDLENLQGAPKSPPLRGAEEVQQQQEEEEEQQQQEEEEEYQDKDDWRRFCF